MEAEAAFFNGSSFPFSRKQPLPPLPQPWVCPS